MVRGLSTSIRGDMAERVATFTKFAAMRLPLESSNSIASAPVNALLPGTRTSRWMSLVTRARSHFTGSVCGGVVTAAPKSSVPVSHQRKVG